MSLNSPRLQPSSTFGITEVVLPSTDDALAIVLPTLAHLSQKTRERWFTWVAPQGVTRELLTAYGFDTSKVRLVHVRHPSEMLWVLWDALVAGNSQTVVASPGKLSDKDLRALELAAGRGQCQGLLIRYR